MAIKSIDPKEIKVGELHRLLLSSVAPRPIALASTINAEGHVNLSPFSFFNVFSANPPILIFSPARRGRDNTTKHTYENVKQHNEVVINIVNHSIVEQMSLSSTEYDSDTNEFVKAGFTQIPSETVKPPRVGESPVSFECAVENVVELGKEGGAGNLVISRIERIHIDTKYLNENGELDTKKLDLVGRMGESWYVRASGESLFEIPKPIITKGIGVDKLPEFARNSTILSGNDLGRLGNLEVLPNLEEITKAKQGKEVKQLFEKNNDNHDLLKLGLETLAKKNIAGGYSQKALEVLMTYKN